MILAESQKSKVKSRKSKAACHTLATVVACCFLLLVCGPGATAQEARSRQLVVELNQSGFVSLKSEVREVAPGARSVAWPMLFTPQFFLDDDNVIHRILVDKAGAFVFGYDLVIKPFTDQKRFEVIVRPLSAEFEERLRKVRHSASLSRARPGLNIPTLPDADTQTLDDGDSFALDLLVNAQLGVKIVDLVKLSFDRAQLLERPAAPPRDFTLDTMKMAVRDFRLYINGAEVTGQNVKRDCEGTLVWFYVTGRGRFIFSLIPRAGHEFQKSATVEDNKISFTLDGDYYEWESSAPIVPGGGYWNLWVMREGDYDAPELFAPHPAKKGRPADDIAGGRKDDFPSLLAGDNANALTETANPSPRKKPWWSLPLRLLIRIGGSDRIESLLPKALRTPLH